MTDDFRDHDDTVTVLLNILHGLCSMIGSAHQFYAAFELTRRLTKLDVICIFF